MNQDGVLDVWRALYQKAGESLTVWDSQVDRNLKQSIVTDKSFISIK